MTRDDLTDIKRRLVTLNRWHKVVLMVLADSIALPLCFFAAMLLLVPDAQRALAHGDLMYLLVPLATIAVFAACGLYKAVLRFIDKHLLIRAGTALAIVALLAYAGSYALRADFFPRIPRNVLMVYWFIAFSYIVSSRMAVRAFLRLDRSGRLRAPPAAGIFGAGDAGAKLALALRTEGKYRPVCFFDDKRELNNRSIAGLRVFHSARLAEVVKQLEIQLVILAVPEAPAQRRQEILRAVTDVGVAAKTLGALVDLTDDKQNKRSARLVRDIRIEDLLGRSPVPPEPELFARSLRGKVVLVTGAGGSIGSELCRQLMTAGPRRLHLLEHSEFALYSIEQELHALYPQADIVAHLGSVCAPAVVQRIFGSDRIDTVYHAAAYKHVPIVEANMVEGLRNNVVGAQVIAAAAAKHGVKTCVLVSTDKAVRPTNVMGASKRIAELIFQAAAHRSNGAAGDVTGTAGTTSTTPTTFCMVRFGNVLASSGSVIPVFQRQIEEGGPLTVTHPDIIRYFMLIPEAAQLVIQAGAMAKGGDTFVLDMGEPVRIVDLARTMLHMAGLRERDERNPHGDIEIRMVGLRPGEKLFEELLIGENTFSTRHPRILGATERRIHHALLDRLVQRLLAVCEDNEPLKIKAAIKAIVPEYAPRISEQTEEADAAAVTPVQTTQDYAYRHAKQHRVVARIRMAMMQPQRKPARAMPMNSGHTKTSSKSSITASSTSTASTRGARMKVLVLGGMAESLVHFRGRLLAELVAYGADVHAGAPGVSRSEKTARALREMRCTSHDVELARTGLNPLADLATLARLTRLMRRERPTHFLGYTVKPVVYGMLAARFAGVPNRTALITGLGSAFNTELTGPRRLVQYVVRALYRISLRGATRVVFQNPDDRALFHRLGLADPQRTAVVNGSGVPLDEFSEQPLPPQEQCHFLFVGRLTRDKGVQEYVEAARRIRRRHPGAVFHLVGWIDANPTSITQQELDQWIADGVVQYHGRLENVRRTLAGCHVFVLPSRHGEGVPRSVLEALATGRAVITTDAPGCRETVVEGENGYLVPVRDHEALARAMESFLLHPDLVRSMGQASRRLAERRFDVEKVNADMLRHMGIAESTVQQRQDSPQLQEESATDSRRKAVA